MLATALPLTVSRFGNAPSKHYISSSPPTAAPLSTRVNFDDAVRFLSVKILARTSDVWGAAIRPRVRQRPIARPKKRSYAHRRSRRQVKGDEDEQSDTLAILQRAPAIGRADPGALAPLARRWGIPLAALMRSPVAKRGPAALLRFYQRSLRGQSSDMRVCLLLCGVSDMMPREVLSKLAVDVLNVSNSLYMNNSQIVGEIILASTGCHARSPAIPCKLLVACGLSSALATHERTGALEDCLTSLKPQSVKMLLADIRSASAVNSPYITLSKLTMYCCERNLLTNRALSGVFQAHVANPDLGMTHAEFAALFVALVECGKPSAMRYWFWVLDTDGDGVLGLEDIADFYRFRKQASEERNGVILAGIQSFWSRISDMVGWDKQITINSLLGLTVKQREFILCALLVRRPDEGHLVNLKLSLEDDDE